MTYAITFSDAKKNKYLKYGNQEMDIDRGLIVPVDAKITVITFNQQDADVANIEISINNVIVETLPITAVEHVFVVDIDVVVGDRVAAENIDDEDLKKSTMTLYFIDPPSPPSGIQVGDHVDVTMITGLLNDYVVLSVPTLNEPGYWTLAPADDLTILTEVGPSFIAMVLRP